MFETTYSFKEYFSKIMKWMAGGLFLTFISSLASSALFLYGSASWQYALLIMSLVGMIGELLLVYKIRRSIQDLAYDQARSYFITYALVSGISLGILVSMYEPFAVVLAFATACAYFGLLYAITTVVDHDFSYVGTICVSALIPLIILSVINIFIGSSGIYTLITFAGIAVFTGLTLWDFKTIERVYNEGLTEENQDVAVLYMALQLYLDFINLFLYILRLLRRNDR